MKKKEFIDLKGKTLVKIEGLTIGNDEVRFFTDDGKIMEMFHEQDCCENVRIEDIIGDTDDLIGTPILLAEEVTEFGDKYQSCTWTFYKIGTLKGSITIRWLGESKGYYSEKVNIKWIKNKKKH